MIKKRRKNKIKKLIIILAVSTLVITSANNWKLVVTNIIINNYLKINKNNNKGIILQNQNNTNLFISKIPTIDYNSNISLNKISPNGTIWIGTYNHGLYKSTDGIKFEQETGLPNYVSAIAKLNNKSKKLFHKN